MISAQCLVVVEEVMPSVPGGEDAQVLFQGASWGTPGNPQVGTILAFVF